MLNRLAGAAACGACRYQYYQSDSSLTVTVLQKDVKEQDADIIIEPRRVSDQGGEAQ